MKKLPGAKLSVFGLVMINVIAVDSLRTLPMGAEYGFSLVFYYLVAAVVFFIPISLVAAELATGWPERGGVYIWIREAFGKRVGFFAIFLQWFYNVCWYPTIMAMIAATFAYCINPNLVNNKIYMFSVITTFFWGSTLLQFLGMKTSSYISTLSAIAGTLVPMLFIIILSAIWISSGKPINVDFSFKSFIPHVNSLNDLVLLNGILFGLVGMEMSASHAREVRNPQKDYPKAILLSALIILATLILASLAVAIVVPKNQISIVSGLLEAFQMFFSSFGMSWFMPVLVLLIVLGALGTVNAWILGPSKGMLMASRDNCLPRSLGDVNKHDVPVKILLIQGVIFTILCVVFLLMPTVSSGVWVLSDITSILSFTVYLLMFSAAVWLRYKYPNVKRTFKVPGGKVGIWVTCVLGFSSSLFVICIGFWPPSQIPVGNIFVYESILVVGSLFGTSLPILLYWMAHKVNQKISKQQQALEFYQQ